MKQGNKNTAIILGAGLGKRMNSQLPKVLHDIEGRPMIYYVAEAAMKIVGNNIIIVTGYRAEEVQKAVTSFNPNITFAFQAKQLGTGHAVMCAMEHVRDNIENVIILCGDTPIINSDIIRHVIVKHIEMENDITVLTVNLKEPRGYGRVITKDTGRILKIVEQADADETQKKITLINSGIYCVKRSLLSELLGKISPANAQGEFYLTDIVELGNKIGNKNIRAVKWENAVDVLGVNNISELEAAKAIIKQREIKID